MQKTFGEKLRKARRGRGLTQRQLAQITGIDQRRLSQFERELRQPSNIEMRDLIGSLSLNPKDQGKSCSKAISFELESASTYTKP